VKGVPPRDGRERRWVARARCLEIGNLVQRPADLVMYTTMDQTEGTRKIRVLSHDPWVLRGECLRNSRVSTQESQGWARNYQTPVPASPGRFGRNGAKGDLKRIPQAGAAAGPLQLMVDALEVVFHPPKLKLPPMSRRSSSLKGRGRENMIVHRLATCYTPTHSLSSSFLPDFPLFTPLRPRSAATD
jgi:hypothetical protein